jgi:hypothetical protein
MLLKEMPSVAKYLKSHAVPINRRDLSFEPLFGCHPSIALVDAGTDYLHVDKNDARVCKVQHLWTKIYISLSECLLSNNSFR